MKVLQNLASICMIGILIISCAAPSSQEEPGPDLDQVRTELQAMEDAYAVASNAKDAEAVVAYYADDAVSMTNNAPSVTGKAAILERIKMEQAQDTSGGTVKFEVSQVWAAGDIAVEAGKSISTDANGKVTTGKYISVFEKRDGKYICVRDIWNNDAPDEKDGE